MKLRLSTLLKNMMVSMMMMMMMLMVVVRRGGLRFRSRSRASSVA